MSEPPAAEAQDLRRTPLYECHLQAGGRMVPFAGYSLPVQYSGLVEEHHAVRRAAGLFDVSHMGEFEVVGPGAERFLQRLVSNDVARLVDGRAQYNLLLDQRAGMLDDLLVYRRAAHDYLLVVNGATREVDWSWIAAQAGEAEGVEVRDRSDETALLALQGPAAVRILTPLADVDPASLRYYSHRPARVCGVDALLSRTGYTGEDGFEIYLPPDAAADVWRTLLERGRAHGLLPAGLGARDTLRLEAGMLLSGQDFGPDTTPWEVGLDWAVKMDKGEFNGAEALTAQRRQGLARRLVGFVLEERGIARHGYAMRLQSTPVGGVVTSGTWSPTCEVALGFCRLEGAAPLERPEPGARLEATIRGKAVAGRVARTPFYRREKS